ncbi:ROK family transcriptional regulator [Saccharopolyspora taberi]|uniref:ROK family protein n=1 Tax=Saccharopolyspora taberi TaxID=60895 RepID=A0ABN3VIU4_9PSEU
MVHNAAARVLALLHYNGPITRSTATTSLGLARSAVGNAVAELEELGLVSTRAQSAAAGRGRPSPVIEAAPAAPFVVACALRQDHVEVAAGALGAPVRTGRRIELPEPPGPDRLAAMLAEQVRRTIRETGGTCAGVCVAVPGALRESDGFVHSALRFGWTDVPFGELVTERVDGPPVRFGRDSNLAAMAEYRRGAAAGAANALVLTCDHRGIGGALVNEGALFVGDGHAVEAGHVVIDSRGPACSCGSRGCLELYADAAALLRTARADSVAEALRATGPRRRTARRLAAGLAGLTTVLDPDRIVLTGFLARLLAAETELLESETRRLSLVARAGRARLVSGALDAPVLTGAADRAFESLLADPQRIGG